MPTEIASRIPGRAIHNYDLLEEVTAATGMDRTEAHDSIHALLDQLVEIDGTDAVILSQRPIRPELLERNPNDLDVYWWITISDDAARTVRESLLTGQDSN